MLFTSLLELDLLNLPVDLTNFTGTAQNKPVFYLFQVILSQKVTENKSSTNLLKKIAYMGIEKCIPA